jgi:hypothetical protein
MTRVDQVHDIRFQEGQGPRGQLLVNRGMHPVHLRIEKHQPILQGFDARVGEAAGAFLFLLANADALQERTEHDGFLSPAGPSDSGAIPCRFNSFWAVRVGQGVDLAT